MSSPAKLFNVFESKAEYRRTVAKAISRERAALGLTQEELAAAVHVSRASIINWEQGKGTLSAFSHQLLKAFFREQWELRGGKPAKSAASKAVQP